MSIYTRKGSKYLWCKFDFKGRTVRQSAGTSKQDQAEAYEAKLRNQLWEQERLGVKKQYLWEDAALKYLKWLPEGASKKTAKGQLRWLRPYLDGKPLHEINFDLLDRIKDARLKAAAAGTANRTLGVVSAILQKACREWGWVASVPKVPFITLPPQDPIWITQEQAHALLNELKPHQRMLTVFALETGLRRHNVTHLEWVRVDLERDICWVESADAKGKAGILVPLTPVAKDILLQVRGLDKSYCFTYRGKPQTQVSTKAWRAARARAGLSDKFTFHSLRHTWATWHIQGGTPAFVLQELGAWKSEKMVKRYAHFGSTHLGEFVAKRGSLLQPKGQ